MYIIYFYQKKSSMWFKENLKLNFSKKEKIDLLRFNAIKIIFIFSIFLFFLNFFILWSNINFELFKYYLPFTYFFLLISMLYYFYFFIKISIKNSKWFLWLIYFLLLLVILLLFLPMVFKNWLSDLINIFNNWLTFIFDNIKSLFSSLF